MRVYSVKGDRVFSIDTMKRRWSSARVYAQQQCCCYHASDTYLVSGICINNNNITTLDGERGGEERYRERVKKRSVGCVSTAPVTPPWPTTGRRLPRSTHTRTVFVRIAVPARPPIGRDGARWAVPRRPCQARARPGPRDPLRQSRRGATRRSTTRCEHPVRRYRPTDRRPTIYVRVYYNNNNNII